MRLQYTLKTFTVPALASPEYHNGHRATFERAPPCDDADCNTCDLYRAELRAQPCSRARKTLTDANPGP